MSTINIPAIIIANLMGITIILAVTTKNSWQSNLIFKENKSLKTMLNCCFISCIADPVCFILDGKPGLISFLLVYGCNLWIYISNILIALMWLKLLVEHMGMIVPKLQLYLLRIYTILNISFLIVNFFNPIIFKVDSTNTYSRLSLFWLYSVFFVIILIYGLILYFIENQKSGKLKFFPVWIFLIPTSLGFIIQSFFYGVSTINPFIAISLTSVFTALQNEFIYRDKLTGLYNRFYLEIIENRIIKNNKRNYTAMMLDLNDFKKINDLYGHEIGDRALIKFSNILTSIIASKGQVIRYAGDEFIILINTQDEDIIKSIVEQINSTLENRVTTDEEPYTLSASIGVCSLSVNNKSIDKYLDTIDKLMYLNKRNYYKNNKNLNRRKKDN